jgi:hypothetical protein
VRAMGRSFLMLELLAITRSERRDFNLWARMTY